MYQLVLLPLVNWDVVHGVGKIHSFIHSYGTLFGCHFSYSALHTYIHDRGNRLLWDYNVNQDKEIYAAYRCVRDAGVTIFDTADSYGTFDLNGRSEQLLGEFERCYLNEKSSNSNLLDNLFSSNSNQQQVATKFAPYPWRIFRNSMMNAAKASLERLQQDKLEIAQLHWSTANYQPFQERTLWDGIADVYDANLCQAIGVSNYGPQQLQSISQYMNQQRHVPIATAQIQYSLMTYQDAQYMNQVCDDLNVRLISYSPLCLGLLTGKYNLDNLPKRGPRKQLFRELLPSAQPLLQTLHAIANEYDKSCSQIAINWTLAKGTVPIPGARTLQQAQQNINSLSFALSKDAIDELDRQALSLSKPMIQNIFQTK